MSENDWLSAWEEKMFHHSQGNEPLMDSRVSRKAAQGWC